MGGGGVVGEKTKNKKTMQGKVTEKQIMQRRSEDKKKKTLQSKLHCWAYKLYLPERQRGT